MIGIIDYGMGNLGSVMNACRFLELDAKIVTRKEEMDACRAVVLPGVGAFGDCMAHLVEHDFVQTIEKWIASGKPLMGICLGLQALFESSEESPGVPGLGIFGGTVKRFDLPKELKVPQIGWNRINEVQPDCPMLMGSTMVRSSTLCIPIMSVRLTSRLWRDGRGTASTTAPVSGRTTFSPLSFILKNRRRPDCGC